MYIYIYIHRTSYNGVRGFYMILYVYNYIKSQAAFLFSTSLRSEVVNKEEGIVSNNSSLNQGKIIRKIVYARPNPAA